jgi:hypothetical protein
MLESVAGVCARRWYLRIYERMGTVIGEPKVRDRDELTILFVVSSASPFQGSIATILRGYPLQQYTKNSI